MGSASVGVCILAGGLGTRIRSLFPGTPKGMIPIRGKPFLEHQVMLLAGQGFRHFVFCLGHLAAQIVHHFGDGARWGVRIEYSVEPVPLGTAGALRYAAPFFQDSLLVLNGDTYVTMDYQTLVAFHKENARPKGAIGTLGLVEVRDSTRYGRVVMGKDRRVVAFQEKISTQAPGLVNAGVYVLEPQILEHIPSERAVSLEKETFPTLLDIGEHLYGFHIQGLFIDIGTPEGYHVLERLLGDSASERVSESAI